MKWAVYVQTKTDKPCEVSEVKVFVVDAETEMGVVALMEQYHPTYMVRGMSPVKTVVTTTVVAKK